MNGLFPMKRNTTFIPMSTNQYSINTKLSTVLNSIAKIEGTVLPFRYYYSTHLKLTRISVQ